MSNHFVCPVCGKDYAGRNRTFCSLACRNVDAAARAAPRGACQRCGKELPRFNKLYCSKECELAATGRSCMVCGKRMPPNNHKYCSMECRKIQPKICPVCGKTYRSPYATCGAECATERKKLDPDWDDKMQRYIRSALSALAQSPYTAPGELNYKAKHWILQAPDGAVYEIDNLAHFIREHPDLFPPSERERAMKGLCGLKASALGKTKRRNLTWFGWRLLGFREQNETYLEHVKK